MFEFVSRQIYVCNLFFNCRRTFTPKADCVIVCFEFFYSSILVTRRQGLGVVQHVYRCASQSDVISCRNLSSFMKPDQPSSAHYLAIPHVYRLFRHPETSKLVSTPHLCRPSAATNPSLTSRHHVVAQQQQHQCESTSYGCIQETRYLYFGFPCSIDEIL